MFENAGNTKRQGLIGLSHAIAFLTDQGYLVSVPLNDSQKYDLIADFGGELSRIQVKTTRQKSDWGQFEVGLRTLGGNQSFHTIQKFDKTSCDMLYVLTEEGGQYLIPTEVIEAKSVLVLGPKYETYKWPKDIPV